MTEADFKDIARVAAKSIREGLLLEEPVDQWAQVHKSSWEPLARMNELGLITYTSQDAIEAASGEIKMHERAFVEGVMRREDVEEFVQKINMFTDKIAYWHGVHQPADTPMSYVLVGPVITVTKWPVEGTRPCLWQRGMGLPLDSKPRTIERIKSDLGIPEHFDAVNVCVIDPKWGRTGTSKKGLFAAIIKALSIPSEFPWTPNAGLHERYVMWKAREEEQARSVARTYIFR